MATLGGGISVGYLSGWLAETIGTRATFGVAALLPLLVVLSLPFARPGRPRVRVPATATSRDGGPLGGGKARLVMLVGLGYAAFGVVLEVLDVPFNQEIVLFVSVAPMQHPDQRHRDDEHDLPVERAVAQPQHHADRRAAGARPPHRLRPRGHAPPR